MQQETLVVCLLIGITLSSMFSDIFKGIVKSESPRISNFVKGLPSDLIDVLQNDEEQAGILICDIIHGDIPAVIEGVATEVWSEIEDDWSAITDFVEAIPSLAPAVLQNIVDDAEDVVSVVGEIFTNPGGVLTIIESGVEGVVSDIESAGGDVISWVGCLFRDCPSTVDDDPALSFSLSCDSIKAAATTTYSPFQPAPTPTYPPAAVTTIIDTPPLETTSQLQEPAATTFSEENPQPTMPSDLQPSPTLEDNPQTTTPPDLQPSPTLEDNPQTTTPPNLQLSPTSSAPQEPARTPASSGIQNMVLQIWLGFSVSSLVAIILL